LETHIAVQILCALAKTPLTSNFQPATTWNLQAFERVDFWHQWADHSNVFASREDAGRRLGHWLSERAVEADLVLGLPRGGVVVAAEVAHILNRPLDVLIVRKIGHPLHREFALGALAEGGVVVLDEEVIGGELLVRSELEQVIAEEQDRLKAYQSRFPHAFTSVIASKAVLLVDDGLATGATTEAAVKSAIKQRARQVIVSAPVGSSHAVKRLERVADRVEVMWVDPEFDAVGRYYDNFPQTTDDEVLALLNGHLTNSKS
jgi:putative phosphoribosyl transferase